MTAGGRATGHRFFVEGGRLAPDQCRQIATVLRLGPGDEVTLVEAGEERDLRLTAVSPREVSGDVVARRTAAAEPRLTLTLALPLLRGGHDEQVVLAASQLGVSAIFPYTSARGVARDLSPAKAARWRKIAREGAEVARRGRVPAIGPLREWTALLDALPRPVVVPWEEEPERPLESALPASGTLSLVIGPEGGLAEAEVALARERAGAVTVTLGPRTFRAETAAIAAVARVLASFG